MFSQRGNPSCELLQISKANIAKGERRTKYWNLFQIFFIPNRILFYENIVKAESRGKWKTQFFNLTMPRRILYYSIPAVILSGAKNLESLSANCNCHLSLRRHSSRFFWFYQVLAFWAGSPLSGVDGGGGECFMRRAAWRDKILIFV